MESPVAHRGRRRTWRKLHLAVNPGTHEIVAEVLTESSQHRAGQSIRCLQGLAGSWGRATPCPDVHMLLLSSNSNTMQKDNQMAGGINKAKGTAKEFAGDWRGGVRQALAWTRPPHEFTFSGVRGESLAQFELRLEKRECRRRNVLPTPESLRRQKAQ